MTTDRDDPIAARLMELAALRGPAKTICPSEVARSIAGSNEKEWRLLMKPIRAEAVRLAHEGRVELRRKGKRVDPDAFRGIYRIAIVDQKESVA